MTPTSITDFWCVAWFETPQASQGADRQALAKNHRWEKGSALSVCFLDGDKDLKDQVREAAKQWTGDDMANISFTFVKGKDAVIRISFKLRGSWSRVGDTCLNVPKNQPTMNLGGITANSPAEEVQRVTLHEFGHALGLIHEHQMPKSGIVWNEEGLITELSGPPLFWDKKKIEENIIRPWAKGECNTTKFDPQSIMLYPIPERWTKNGFSSRLNMKLSENDRKFIRRQYPHDG